VVKVVAHHQFQMQVAYSLLLPVAAVAVADSLVVPVELVEALGIQMT
jgi:hypothetical protein